METRENKIDYWEIFKESLGIVWKNRFLWWLGILASLGSGGFNFSFPGRNFPDRTENSEIDFFSLIQKAGPFYEAHSTIILASAAFFLLIFFALIYISATGRAGLIFSLGKIVRKEPSGFSDSWKEGKKYWKKILVLSFSLGLFSFLAFFILGLPVAILFFSKNYLAGFLMTFLAILIFVPLAIILFFIKTFSQIYLVIGKIGLRDSLENSYSLFWKNWKISLIFALFFIVFDIIFSTAMLLSLLIILIPGAILGVLAYFLAGKIGAISIGIIALLAILAFLFVVAGIISAFRQSAWLIFFQKIARTPKQEEILIAETESPPIEKPAQVMEVREK